MTKHFDKFIWTLRLFQCLHKFPCVSQTSASHTTLILRITGRALQNTHFQAHISPLLDFGEFRFGLALKVLPKRCQWEGTCLPMQQTSVPSLGWKDPEEEDMATHSSILAWRIPRTEGPVWLQSVGSQSRTRLKQLSRAMVFHSGSNSFAYLLIQQKLSVYHGPPSCWVL